MKKLLILQNLVLPYRKPVYNGLARDYDVTVLHSGVPTVDTEDTYKEILIPTRRIGPFFVQNDVFREISSGKYDVVIAMFDLRWPAYILPMFKSRQRYGRWIFWGHRYSRSSVVNYARDRLMRKADAILLYGHEEIDRMTRRGIQRHKIFVADNTIHVPNHHDYSRHVKSNFLFVGRLVKRKKIDLLITIFARIRDRIPENIKLEIVGDGECRDILRKIVRNSCLEDRVIFHGRVDQHDLLAEIFARACAYVSPGPIGLGILHSFAYGVPVVTTNYLEGSEKHGPEAVCLKHRFNGFTYTNEDELANILIDFCNYPQLSSIMGQNAYDFYSKKRTLDIMLNGFKQSIENQGCA